MRRATEATRHKTASASGYAYGCTQHIYTKPQGFIIRPPLLTTNKVFERTKLAPVRNQLRVHFACSPPIPNGFLVPRELLPFRAHRK